MTNEPRIRYSDAELEEFKELIEQKIAKAEEELLFTAKQIKDLNENGFNQQGGDWYDDSSNHSDLEMLQRMAARQEQFVRSLRMALIRISNKTYGICSVTGNLIDKNRLRLVPHATKSVEGKDRTQTDKPRLNTDTLKRLDRMDKQNNQPQNNLDGKVRIPPQSVRRNDAESDWQELSGDSLEAPIFPED